MGKSVVATNLLSKAKTFWGWFIKKSPAFIVLTSLTVVSVLGLGVGGTLAATGVIPNPFASSASVESAPETESDYSGQGQPPIGDGKLPSDVGEWGAVKGICTIEEECELARRGTALIQSGWTGTVYNFSKDGFYSYTMVNVTYRDDVSTRVEINGRLFATGTIHDCKPIAPERFKQDWSGHCSTMTNAPLISKEFSRGLFGACKPGGDTYLVEASGGGYSFRESGVIPPEFFECPPPQSTVEPSPTPTTEPSPTPTTEPSPTPTTEPSPTPTTEPSPTPTGP